ncbi:MAG: hypothetical protein U0361_05510 [Nitrospiraceae bacterium]
MTGEIRQMFRSSPEVTTIVSQLGRPDDGTDRLDFFNERVRPTGSLGKEWRPGMTKDRLIEEIRRGG